MPVSATRPCWWISTPLNQTGTHNDMKESNEITVSTGTKVDSTEASVGRRLRQMRKNKRLTVAGLAEASGVSAGMISQIERGLSNPSIGTLERLRAVLGIPLTAFFEDRKPTDTVLDAEAWVRRADKRPFFQVGANGMSKELLSPSGEHELQFMIITIPPHSQSHEVLIGEGEKAGLVLEGRVKLVVDGESTILEVGDSFQFDSRKPHGVANDFDASARLMWIMHTRPQPAQF